MSVCSAVGYAGDAMYLGAGLHGGGRGGGALPNGSKQGVGC
jgi:hypothetical protein